LDDRSISVPVVNSILLLGTIDKDAALVFVDIAIRIVLAALVPYCIKISGTCREVGKYQIHKHFVIHQFLVAVL